MKQIAPFIKRSFLGLAIAFIVGFSLNTDRFFGSTRPTSTPQNFVINEPSPERAAPLDNRPENISAVLGTSTIFSFSGSENHGSHGGVIVLNAQESPVLTIPNYQEASGRGTFTLYKATKSDLINYLLYRRVENSEWGSSIEKIFRFDSSSAPVDKTFEQEIVMNQDAYQSNPINLPIEGVGIWFLKGEVGGKSSETMLIRTNLAGIIHQADNQNVFWVQDTKYSSVPDASIELFNSNTTISNLQNLTTNPDGLATDSVNGALDFAIVTKNDDLAIIPVNLSNLNYRQADSGSRYSSFAPRISSTKVFSFTDRFLYKPGDTIHFKAVIRDDDDADYSIDPKTYQVTFGTYEKSLWQQSLQVTAVGTIDASIEIPEDTKTGYFDLTIKDGDRHVNSSTIQVANFRKPDASISVNTDKLMYLPGEKVKISFSGTAFLGQPLRNQDIRYKIYQYKADIGGDYSEVKFNTAEQYFSKELELTQGTVTLDKKGQATIDITAENGTGYRQFWIIETEYLDGSSTAANSAVRTLINPGDFVIDAERANLEFVQNVPVTFPFKLSKNKADADLSGAKISGKLLKSENNSYSVVLDSLQTTSDDDGRFSITFTPPSFGSYKLELETQDKKGNPIKDEQTFYVNKTQSDGQPVNIFTITPDKETYSVGDRAKINLKTSPGIRHIFVSVGREYSRDFRVLSVVNGQVSFEFEVKEKYQPNVFVYAGSFLGESWKSNYAKVSVDTSDKEVSIKITPAQQTYGPGATAQFDITATDGQGQPVETDLAFWVFDKALLELHGTYFDGIFKKFWDERSYSNTTNHSYAGISSSGAEGGGGCFAGDTLITMADGSKKRIDQVSQGDVIQTFNSASAKQHVSAKVTATHTVAVDGYLILNGTLKLTPEHILFVNDKWITAGEIRRGDTLIKADGAEVLVSSIEWVKGSFDVYNLTVEKFHTFFANDMYVHNDKGEARSTFKDTAYWNPHVSTDANGKASVTVPLPDNLTTWVAAAVSANAKTQVGIGTTEFIVTKDFVVRPIFPPFVRTGDTLNLSGLISNFTDARDSFSVEAKLTGGDISDTTQKISIDAKDIEEVIFPTKITGSNEDAIFSLKAQGKKKNDLIDEVTEKFPIYEYGSWQTHFAKGTDSIDFPLRMTLGTDSARLESVLDLKPSRYSELDEILRPMASGNLGGTIYGRGATLIAASILKQHGKQLGITFNQNELNEEVSEAVIALMSYQQEHGFWIDYNTNSIDIDATMFAMEALAIAQKAGYVVDQNLIESSLNYIAGQNAKNQEMDLLQQYVFALYPNQKRTPHAIDVSNSQDAEFVAKAAIANKRQGFVTSNQEENKLLELAHSSNTQLGWKIATEQTGNEKVFVLRPTAWATYAAQELEAPSIDVAKSLDYLFRNSQYVVEAQALQALATVKYFADTNQLPPNYSYRVLADQQVLTEGKVTSTQQVLQSIVLSPELFSSSATVVIEKTGAGQLISSLAQKEFFTERSHPEESHKLSIARKYLSTKPNGEATEVGDLIIVQFEITGLGLGEDNIELEDYLPSGLVAIDESLDNGEFDQSPASSTYASKQITDQGMLLNFSTWDANGTYSYKARVVSEGIFDTPPAVVRLKNDPSIWASTASETFVVDGKNALQSSTGMLKSSAGLDKIVAILLGILAGSLIMAFLYRERIKAFIQKRRDGQPTAEPPSDPQS